MVHLLIIKVNSKEIDGVPVIGTPVGSRTEIGTCITKCSRKSCKYRYKYSGTFSHTVITHVVMTYRTTVAPHNANSYISITQTGRSIIHWNT